MTEKPSFLNARDGGGPTPEIGPKSDPEYTDGAAPGSPWGPAAMTPTPNAIGDSAGAPATTGGFRPSSEGPSLPTPPVGTGVEYPIGYPKPVR